MFDVTPTHRPVCNHCGKHPQWTVYFRTKKQEQHYCNKCVPEPGTPRYSKMKRYGGFFTDPSKFNSAVWPMHLRWRGIPCMGLELVVISTVRCIFKNGAEVLVPVDLLEVSHPLELLGDQSCYTP